MKTYLLYLFIFVSYIIKSQSLIINEVSNGSSGTEEYVELLVVGTPSCSGTNSMDIRNYYIDDNNGSHAPGSGTGIATGCVRFKNIPFWQTIPFGTIILIYNNADKNSSITLADDLLTTDGNCRLIIPINSTLLETNSLTPVQAGTMTYPTSGFTSGGNWNVVGMANSDDSFQTVDNNGNIIFSVSYNNNNLNTDIYFPSSQGGMVIYNTNSVNTTYANQANWANTVVSGNETPGLPNTPANATWINSMNNNCTPFTALSVSQATTSNVTCGACNGTASVTTGSSGVYTYTWVNSSNTPIGQNTNSATNLCAGIYSVIVRSSIGCTVVTSATISSTSSNTLTINSTNETCGNCNGSASVTINGPAATYTYQWVNSSNTPIGQTTDIASNLCSGIYSVIVNSSLGCTNTQSVSIANTASSNTLTVNSTSICNGSSVILSASVTSVGGSYSWIPSSGITTSTISVNPTTTSNYTVTYALNNCTTTAIAQVTVVQAPIINIIASSLTICPNETATLTATGGSGAYNWSNTLNTNSVNISSAGTISLIDNNVTCGPATASIVIATANIYANISANTLSGIKPLAVTFTNTSTSATSFTWTLGNGVTDVLNNSIAQTYTAVGIYTVSLVITNNNCKDSTSVLITVNDVEPEIEIPNVFTPNGDGVNDIFKITAINTKSFSADIFNRWGTKLYSWSDITTGWNGKANGKDVTDGVYFYMIKITTAIGEDVTKQGTVSLFR